MTSNYNNNQPSEDFSNKLLSEIEADVAPDKLLHNNRSNNRKISSYVLAFVILVFSLIFVVSGIWVMNVNKKADPAYISKNIDSFAEKEIEKSKPEVIELSDNALDLSQIIDTNLSIRQQDINTVKKNQLNMSDGVSFMVPEIVPNWSNPDISSRPAQGNEFLMVVLEIGYRGVQGPKEVTTDDFYLRNSGGEKVKVYQLKSEYATNNILYDPLISKLSSGEQQRHGWVIFEIKKSESPVSLVYEKKGFTYNGKPVVIKGEVSL
ncbi:hypothetical protein KDA00_01305 [Candidatus Saccharibacteria bacterium]|nr:hypothetical protein [Candidatus Saccharibacteria bacterium]